MWLSPAQCQLFARSSSGADVRVAGRRRKSKPPAALTRTTCAPSAKWELNEGSCLPSPRSSAGHSFGCARILLELAARCRSKARHVPTCTFPLAHSHLHPPPGSIRGVGRGRAFGAWSPGRLQSPRVSTENVAEKHERGQESCLLRVPTPTAAVLRSICLFLGTLPLRAEFNWGALSLE